ncbi:hypothetical protein JXL19_05965 [bacterium]|nr:hypothetical protein [bacterium]
MAAKGKRRYSYILIFLIVWSILILPTRARSEPKAIRECGMAQVIDGNTGRAKAQALQDAQRNAVEKGIGTLIDSQTIVNNAQLIKDSIYSQASGYVTDYRIISEGLSPDGDTYETCIEGKVEIADIKDDLRAIGILKQKAGNPRFMAIYLPQTSVSASVDDDAMIVRTAEKAINEAFLKKGFIVLDRGFVNGFIKELKQMGYGDMDINSLSVMALKYQADLLLLFDIAASERTDIANKYFKEVSLSLDIRAVAPATAEIISSEGQEINVRTSKKTGDDYYEDPSIAKYMTKLAKKVSEDLLGGTLAYFERQSHEGTRFSCMFKDFGKDEIYTIVEVIENMGGYKDKNVRSQFSNSIQVDINYTGKRFDFQRELISGLEKKGIYVDIKEAKGNDFLIHKASGKTPFMDSDEEKEDE